jgi:hypothetical protein
VVDLLLVWISFGITLADTFRHHAGVTLGVASVFAVFALHSRGVLEEIPTESTTHNVVELVLDELVTEHLVNLLLALTNGTLSTKSEIHRSAIRVGLDEGHFKLDLSSGFQVKPAVNRAGVDLRLRPRASPKAALRACSCRRPRTKGSMRWTHWELRAPTLGITHSICGDPARAIHLSFDPLTTHLLNNV